MLLIHTSGSNAAIHFIFSQYSVARLLTSRNSAVCLETHTDTRRKKTHTHILCYVFSETSSGDDNQITLTLHDSVTKHREREGECVCMCVHVCARSWVFCLRVYGVSQEHALGLCTLTLTPAFKVFEDIFFAIPNNKKNTVKYKLYMCVQYNSRDVSGFPSVHNLPSILLCRHI